MKVKALVAARAGSVRVSGKNTRPFANTTLLENKIAQLQRLSRLDGVIVSSEDPGILAIASSYGCEVQARDPYYASNEVSMSDVFSYMASRCDADIIVYANCTSPLIRDSTIEALIEEFESRNGQFDSLNTASFVREFMFFNGRPINYDLRNTPRSQDLPEIMALNFAINIVEREAMISCKNVVGRRPKLRIIDEVEAVDIDTPLDFSVAEYLYVERGGAAYVSS